MHNTLRGVQALSVKAKERLCHDFGSGMGETEEDFQIKGQPGRGLCDYRGTGKGVVGAWNYEPTFPDLSALTFIISFHFIGVG